MFIAANNEDSHIDLYARLYGSARMAIQTCKNGHPALKARRSSPARTAVRIHKQAIQIHKQAIRIHNHGHTNLQGCAHIFSSTVTCKKL